jgi:protein SCO1/2
MTTVKRTMIFVILGLAALLAAWLFIMPLYKEKPLVLAATVVKPSQMITAFSLQDYDGKPFSEKSLRGHWTLLFFGYVGCPDICPQTLSVLRDAWDTYPSKQAPVRFVFANIEPTPINNEVLKTFLHNYNPNFIGVSGTPEAVQQLSSQLGVYAKQQQDKLDHTASLMLIDPQGRLSAVFTPPFSAHDVVQDLEILTRG